jgi:hypothetical protein
MIISKKIEELVRRANKLAYPNGQSTTGDQFEFIALGIFPLPSGNEYQIWLDKWRTHEEGADHIGGYLKTTYDGNTLKEALSSLEEDLAKEETAPVIITQGGHTYRRVD